MVGGACAGEGSVVVEDFVRLEAGDAGFVGARWRLGYDGLCGVVVEASAIAVQVVHIARSSTFGL